MIGPWVGGQINLRAIYLQLFGKTKAHGSRGKNQK